MPRQSVHTPLESLRCLQSERGWWPGSVLVTLDPASTPKRITTWTCTRKDGCSSSLPGRSRAVCDISHLASLESILTVLRVVSWPPSTLMMFTHDLVVPERAHSSILPLVTAVVPGVCLICSQPDGLWCGTAAHSDPLVDALRVLNQLSWCRPSCGPAVLCALCCRPSFRYCQSLLGFLYTLFF